MEQAKQSVVARVDEIGGTLVDASHRIHAQPELGFAEHHAHELLTGILEAEGVEVQRSAYGLETAFEAGAGTSGPLIAVLCEYDALPDIGHACGHNVIATAGLGAGLAVAGLADQLGGRIRILGTPAEEGGGGKVLMLERGAFDGVEAALMVHPADADLLNMTTLAVQQVTVTYTGLSAHAAAAPEKGLNALDAAVLGYMNVAALRQHIAPEERIHGIFTEVGAKANIVPRSAGANWYVRSPTRAGAEELGARVVACLEAGALATGCTVSVERAQPPFAEVQDNLALLEAYAANSATLGRPVQPVVEHQVVGSTDLGNVSYEVPSIHPMIKVAPFGTAIHTTDFAEHAAGPEADRAVLDGAKALAMTVLDCWADEGVLEAATRHFEAATGVRAEGPPNT